MLERETRRKYLRELGGAMFLYLAALCGSLFLAKPMEAGTARTLLLVTPVIPAVLSVWAIARHLGRVDEFVRLRSLESLAVAVGVTASFSITYGFLESAGFPKLSMFWVWGVLGITWGLTACLRCLVAK